MSVMGIFIVLIFIIFAALMVTQKLPALVALPSMAIAISIVAGMGINDIFTGVIGSGAIRLHTAVAAAIFGAVLAQVINRTGIAESIVMLAAELGGDKPLVVAFTITATLALMFTSLSGLGSVIMVGTIALPIMISVGIKPVVSGCLLILGLNLGGLFNISNYAFYQSVLKIDIATIKSFSLAYGSALGIVSIIFIIINVPHEKVSINWAMISMGNTKNVQHKKTQVPLYSLITPILPVLLMFLWPYLFKDSKGTGIQMDIISAMIIGILFGVLTTKPREYKNIISSSFIEGIKDAAPAIALMMGIGMVLKAVTDNKTASVISPIIAAVLPSSKIGYILLFLILSPLALYRGPMNMYGLGSGIAALMISSGLLPITAIMGAMLAVGNMQGVCDPTNTFSVWTAYYTNTDTISILKKTMPYILAVVLLDLIFTALFKWNL